MFVIRVRMREFVNVTVDAQGPVCDDIDRFLDMKAFHQLGIQDK